MILTLIAALAHLKTLQPAKPEPLPQELVWALGTNSALVTAFYRYDLGGFIDHEWLWRIDAPPAAITHLVTSLKLQSTNRVPDAFWEMPPSYWPHSLPSRVEIFQSPGFVADTRGQDGNHYFLLHDKREAKTYIWLKNNF